eukprot:CAMPEP_0170404754 /NCGR_PEP_ID=MMETSP0117_2-20130122/26804_1 /TAXON_ID=400756 /ORGANISM="Durinskia baltica, Strain CSIRO CS-38" /LENGTH=165 /DNA_ID=CAMNT_0010661799 /DNA_START=50 /DNA_END=543 /DNA_ORIENTATION=+
MGRHCFFTEVKDGRLQEYLDYHDNIYPEVAAGLRAAGVTQLTIFNVPCTRQLVMYIETAGDLDFGRATGAWEQVQAGPALRAVGAAHGRGFPRGLDGLQGGALQRPGVERRSEAANLGAARGQCRNRRARQEAPANGIHISLGSMVRLLCPRRATLPHGLQPKKK